MTSDAEPMETLPASEAVEAEAPSQGEQTEATEAPTPAAAEMQTSESPKSIAELAPKMALPGKILKTDLAGAIVDVGLERPGFLHISQLSGNKRVNNVTDVVKEGDEVTVYVLDVNKEKGRISLTLVKPPAYLWSELEGMVNETITGEVVRLEKFGAFVDFGAERPGLIHVSELSDEYVSSPEAELSVGEEIEARIIGVDARKKQIDLSRKAALATEVYVEDDEEDEASEEMTAMAIALRKAMADSSDKGKKRRKKSRGPSDEQSNILARTLQTQQKE